MKHVHRLLLSAACSLFVIGLLLSLAGSVWLTGHGLVGWVMTALLTGLCALVGAIVYAAVFGGLALATRRGHRTE